MANARENTPREPAAVFVAGGKPVKFYLWSGDDEHASWGLTDGQRDALREKIEDNGGVVVARAHKADTVIVQEHGVEPLRAEYMLLRRYAEPPTFVSQCLRRGRYEHGRVKQHPLGGRLPAGEGNGGRESYRVEFTDADDEHMCQFLASVIPYAEQGGRKGNKVWMKLEETAQKEPAFKWARRHPWTSWQNRYKKRWHIFDPRIAEIAAQNPPPADGQGVYPYSRRENGRSRLMREFMRAQGQQPQEPQEPNGGEDEQDENRAQNGGAEEDEVEVEVEEEEEGPGEFEYYDPFADEVENARAAAHKQVTPPAGRARRPAHVIPSPEEDYEEEEEEFQFEFEPPEPGPSGKQRSPSVSPAVPSPPPEPRQQLQSQSQQPQKQTQTQKVAPRPANRQVTTIRNEHGPMSSQATLVGPVPTQLRSVPRSQQRQATAGPGPSTVLQRRGKDNAVEEPEEPEMDVDVDEEEDEDEDEEFKLSDEEDEEIEPSDEEDEEIEPSDEDNNEEGEESYSVIAELGDADELLPQTNEDELDVEAILKDQEQEQDSSTRSVRLSPEAPEPDAMDLDSDDQRTDSFVRKHHREAAPTNARKRPRLATDDDADEDIDDVTFASTLNLTASASKPIRRVPVTPHIRGRGRAGSASPTSSESAVPLEHTRASVEKKRLERAASYVAPEGTRAAELSLRARQQAAGAAARASRRDPGDGEEAAARPTTPSNGKRLRNGKKVMGR